MNQNKKLSVIIPYRDREEHLNIFINEFPRKCGVSNFDITVVEQTKTKPFNRAKLLNIGFHYNQNADYFAFHDVDLIPFIADYSYPETPCHAVSFATQFLPHGVGSEYYGGVNLFNKLDFIKINGFSNEFWGWGAEDDDLRKRVISEGFPLIRRTGLFESLKHKHNGPQHSNYQNNFKKLQSSYNFKTDGLSNLSYEIKEKTIISDFCIKILVEI